MTTTPTANKSYFTPSPKLLQFITKTHIRLYESTNGAVGSLVCQRGEPGHGPLRLMRVLLLTTIGRKSGEARKVTLPFFQYDDRIFVIGSNAGRDNHPAWFINLRANPDVTVMIGPATVRAKAKPLEGEAYAEMWARHTALWPRWRLYQAQTKRPIPVVELCLL